MKQKIALYLILSTVLIHSYATDGSIKKYFDETFVLALEIQGNFTDSGRERETLYIYQKRIIPDAKPDPNLGIAAILYCLYGNDNTIIKEYQLPFFFTLPFTKTRNLNNSPLGELGQQIIIGNMIYGFITDLNNNGRDEIYLYSLTGSSFYPSFYEYNIEEKKFKSILDYDGSGTLLLLEKIDREEQKLFFHGYAVGSNQDKQEKLVYIWDDKLEHYEIIRRDVF